jgi:hypothetical protein
MDGKLISHSFQINASAMNTLQAKLDELYDQCHYAPPASLEKKR